MKKSVTLASLAILLSLTSCAGGESIESTISSSTTPVLDSSSTPISSSPIENNTSSSTIAAEENWTDDEITLIGQIFGEGTILPYPTGLTDSRESYNEEIDGDLCFCVYDEYCGDLLNSYGSTLIDVGYEFLENQSGYDEEYSATYNIYELSIDEDSSIIIQVTYYDETEEYSDAFEILSYVYNYSDSDYTSDDFPYSTISETLGIDVNSTVLPSFEIIEGESYDVYPYEGTDFSYVMVGGTYDTSITDFQEQYQSSLEDLGYVITSETEDYFPYGVNKEAGLAVEFGDWGEGYFSIQVYVYKEEESKEPEAGDKTLTLTNENIPFASYVTGNDSLATVDGIKLYFSNVILINGLIQFSSTKKRDGGFISNVTDMVNINSIVVTKDSSTADQYYAPLSLYVSTSAITSVDQGTKITPTSSDGTYVYNVSGSYGYFILVDESNQYASKNSSITINYTL